MKKRSQNWRDLLLVYGFGLVLVFVAFYTAQKFIKPAPPNEITIAAGAVEGAYYRFAQQYANYLHAEKITLHIRTTAGSIENAQLLAAGEVDIAFIQGGTLPIPAPENLEGLASLYYEPLWLFYKQGLDLTRLGQLKTLNIGIGPDGSGTQELVLRLLDANDLDKTQENLLPLTSIDAKNALQSGTLDAAFFVTRPETKIVSELLHNPNIELASFARAAAYSRRYTYLTKLTMPEGSQDLIYNAPAQDIDLIAPTASLAVNNNIHPAIVGLLMQAATETHSSGGWFEDKGEFPNGNHLELPLNSQAEKFYKHGPPFLQRYLPFWAASIIDRLKIMLLPLLALMLPLFKILPPLYKWRMRRRIIRLYDELDELDPDTPQLAEMSLDDTKNMLEKLIDLDVRAHYLKVPVGFSDRLYDLRQHIDMVKIRLRRKLGSP